MKYLSFLFAIVAATLSLCSDDNTTHTSYIYDSKYQGYQGYFTSTNPYQPPSTHFVPIDTTPQDIARQQRFSYPTYSAHEISAIICSGWSSTDFARAVEYATYEAIRQGKSPDEVKRNLLRQYELYRIPAFCHYIKTLPGYRPHIKALRDRLVAQKPKRYKTLRKLGLLDPTYVHQLDLAEKLYAEILAEEKAEQRAAQQQQEAALYRQQELLHSQHEALQQLPEEWTHIQDIYQEYGLCDNGRYEQRKQALDSVTNSGCVYETKSYTISPAATQLIRDMGADIIAYQTCYGNQFQQVIHQECIDGIDRLTALPETSPIHPYKESMALCFDAAREYNQAGAVDKATAVTDFCASLLDYGKAIGEGAISGLVGAVEDMLEYPQQALLCAVAGEYVLAYQLSKILYNVADIGVTYAFDRERGKKQWDEYVAPVTQLIDAINNKELSLRDGLKGATQLAVQWKAQGKLLKGMNKFCKTTKAKVLEFAKNNPLVTPEQYMTTPEGILLQSAHNVQQPQAPGSGPRLIKREQVLPQMQTYEQARNKALEIIGDVDPHTVEPHIGTVGVGEGQITGVNWHNGKVTLRLDWDPVKQAHINITDYRTGSGRAGKSIAIPFKGDENTIKSLLRHLNSPASIDAAINILKKSERTVKFDLFMQHLQGQNLK